MRPQTDWYTPVEFGYRNVLGWLTDAEAEELTRLAARRTVLEVGTFCGRSAVAMARTAHRVICLDTFQGYEQTKHLPIRDTAMGNFDRAGIWDRVRVIHGPLEEMIPLLDLKDVDMVFYDADHSFQSTWNGLNLLHKAGLREDAVVAMHDCDEEGPLAARDCYHAKTMRPFRMVESLAIFEGQAAIPKPYNVMLGLPHDGRAVFGIIEGAIRASAIHNVRINPQLGSLLANQFNQLLCDALNEHAAGRCDILAILHGDISPEPYWLDKMVSDMDLLGADLISAVSPIKDTRGITSTGVAEPGWTWTPLRRFTLKELCDDGMPAVFGIQDTPHPDKILLHNSGCWVADIRKPVFHQLDDKGELKTFFTIKDRVIKPNGQFVPEVESEDWFMSRRLHELGAKTYVTRKVKLLHDGVFSFPNYVNWGEQDHDEQTAKLWQGKVQPNG